MSAYEALAQHIAEYNDLLNIANVLKWDMRAMMPAGGAITRGKQLGTLNKIAKETFISDTTARLLDAAEAEVQHDDTDSYRRRAVQQTRLYYDIQQRIPSELVSTFAALEPESETAWALARQQDDFAAFMPYLQRMLDLNRQLADAIGYQDHPYDALVFEYEPSMTTVKLRALFAELKAGIMPLLEQITAHDDPLPRDLWAQTYERDKQKAFALEVAQSFGYDLHRGRLDSAPHPFEISFTREDVRITTRYDDHYLPMALFGTLHETGHGLYEQNVAPDLTRTALTTDFLGQYAVGGTSYGAHEFSSRLWENQIGRSRDFWQVHLPRLKAFFPEQLAGVDVDLFYRAVNRVQPSLIRVEADEVTYNLHIMIRFEIGTALVDGSLAVADLPEAWNAKYQTYLGVAVPNNRLGCMQDVHWAGGQFGGFPGYTIGNLMSAQVMEAAYANVDGLGETLAAGDYLPLKNWLTETYYQHGRAYSVTELLQRTHGNDLIVQPYVDYLTAKFSEIYGLA